MSGEPSSLMPSYRSRRRTRSEKRTSHGRPRHRLVCGITLGFGASLGHRLGGTRTLRGGPGRRTCTWSWRCPTEPASASTTAGTRPASRSGPAPKAGFTAERISPAIPAPWKAGAGRVATVRIRRRQRRVRLGGREERHRRASTPASVSFNAQLRHAMTHPFHALVGIGAVVSNVETDINGWIGIAYQL